MKARERERVAEHGDVELLDLYDEAANSFRTLPGANGALELRAWTARVHGRPYRVYQSRDPIGEIAGGAPDLRWHLSVSHRDGRADDVPPWRDLVAIAHAARPGIPFIVGVPPRSWWINAHGGVLHLVETRDENLINQWRREAKGHTPS
jgi:hypothetical protein